MTPRGLTGHLGGSRGEWLPLVTTAAGFRLPFPSVGTSPPSEPRVLSWVMPPLSSLPLPLLGPRPNDYAPGLPPLGPLAPSLSYPHPLTSQWQVHPHDAVYSFCDSPNFRPGPQPPTLGSPHSLPTTGWHLPRSACLPFPTPSSLLVFIEHLLCTRPPAKRLVWITRRHPRTNPVT